tara:strand:+ start:706 stop:1494 length:789 start_codon:yes stop_codon:yes gene_type:complete
VLPSFKTKNKLTIKNKTMKLKTGTFDAAYPIKALKMAKVNRETKEKHAENFSKKLSEYGWLMPIIISSNGDVIEGHHRIESAKLLNQKTIPAYIVNWVDTSNAREHLNCIISLNNGNLSWSMFDYLKAFSEHNVNYKLVYDSYCANTNNITVGNIIHLFFSPNNKKFKFGKAEVQDEKFSNYLLNKISNLNQTYGSNRVAAYCVREFIAVAYNKTKKDLKAIEFLFMKWEKMLRVNHPSCTSIRDFRPTMEMYLNDFNLCHK